MIITEFLERNAKFYASDIALVEINPSDERDRITGWKEFNLIESTAGMRYRREMTWGRFDKKANRFANLLLSRGIKKGEKVAILLMNCLEWLPIYFGILKCGAVAVPLNYRYTGDEIKYCLDLAEADFLIFGPEFTQRVDEIQPRLSHIRGFFFVGDNAPPYSDSYDKFVNFASPLPPAIELNEDDNAAIYFSSGTTGFPKAILHAHRALVSSCITEQAHHMQKRDDCFLLIPPLYHTGAKMHWFGSLISGSKAVILKGTKPEWILSAASEEKATIVWLLVPWAQDILDAIDSGEVDMNDYDLSAWRLMHIGAQPVPPSLIKRWKEHFPLHQYDTNYGLSESIGPGCVHLGVENSEKVGAIGVAGHLWEARIVNESGCDTAFDEVGELIVKGPGVMKCYFRNPEATAEVLKNGWLYTGDMAKRDKDNFIYLVDRKKDVVISGGENIYPVQIEDFLRKNDKIKDIAVIGVPDERLGEIAAAVIQVKEGCTLDEAEITSFCEELPRYKRPRKIIFDNVPRNLTGKIEKPVLRQRYGAEKLVEKETTK